jgi:DNA-directed RNA polymerase specialized sigma24 family protein
MRICEGVLKYCWRHNHVIRVPTADKRYGKTYEPYAMTHMDAPDALMFAAPVEDDTLRIAVSDVLAQMPEQQARNLWAVCAEEWGQKEYADHVGQHPNSVKQSVKRGKDRFRKLWEGVPLSRQDRNACAMWQGVERRTAAFAQSLASEVSVHAK